MRQTCIAAALCAATFTTSADAASLISDIAYGTGDRQVLDLYLPDNQTDAPVVVFVHGGRWFRGDKSQIERNNRIEALTRAGIGIASINYTYTSEEIWPTQINDVMAALDFVADNGATYGYDADRMAVFGQSSGAHLALWAGLLSAEDPDLDLAAVVSWYAPSDLYNITQDRIDDAVPGENERFPEPSPESLLIGLPVPDNKPEADAASPTVYAANLPAGQALPDFLLAHGTDDFVISPLQSERMKDILIAQGGASNVELRLVDGAGHGGDLFDAETVYATQYLAARLDPTPVPIPASLPLMMLGLGAIGITARRKRRS